MILVAQRTRPLDTRIGKCGNFAGQRSVLPELGLNQFREPVNRGLCTIALCRDRYRVAHRRTEHHEIENRGAGNGLATA